MTHVRLFVQERIHRCSHKTFTSFLHSYFYFLPLYFIFFVMRVVHRGKVTYRDLQPSNKHRFALCSNRKC